MAAAKLHERKGRRAAGLSLLEGPTLFADALAAGVAIETVFTLDSDESIDLSSVEFEVFRVTQSVLAKLSSTDHPRGPVAVFRPDPLAADNPHAIVLWALADPGNVGTLIRTAAAFSLDVITLPGTADIWSPKVLRAAAGGHFTVGFGEVADLTDLRDRGYRIIAAVAKGGAWPDEVRVGDSGALVVGSEAHGLPDEVADGADLRVSIPMPGGIESFNAGVAGSILAYTLFGG